MLQRVKEVQESDLRMVGALARNIQRVIAVTQADIDAAAAQGKAWLVKPVVKVSDPLDNLRGGTQLVIKQNSILPGQNVMRVMYIGGQAVVVGPDVPPLSLPDAIANSLQYVKAFGGTEQRSVPSQYQQVNFVTNTSSTVLNTGIVFNFAKNYQMELRCRAVGGSFYMFLSRKTQTGDNNIINGLSGSSSTLGINGNFNGTSITSGITRTVGNTLYIKMTAINGVLTLYVRDETANTEDTVTGTYTVEDVNALSWIGLWGNEVASNRVDVNADVYMAKIIEDGVTVLDYVPCLNVATAGFYDKVSGTFKTTTNLVADGNTVPTPDTPMNIVCNNGVLKYGQYGKNLFDKNTITLDRTITADGSITPSLNNAYSDFIPVAYGKTYYIGARGLAGVAQYNSSKDFISRIGISSGGGTYTPESGISYIRANLTQSSSDTLQIEEGTTATEYEPYHFGLHTDGTVETIVANSKNYLTRVGETTGQIINADGTVSSNSNYSISAPFTLPAGDYTCTWTSGAGPRPFSVFKCDANGNIILTDDGGMVFYKSSSVDGVNTGYFTLDSTTLVRSAYRNNVTDLAIFSTSGPATAEMLLKVGDYTDVQEILSGRVKRNVGIKVLDGTENFETATATNCYSLTTTLGTGNFSDRTIYCTHFGNTPTQPAVGDRQGLAFITNKGTDYTIAFGATTQFATQSLWKAWLAQQFANGTPVIVVYPLATETTESVTGQTLQVQAGDNTLEITQASLDGLELEVEYVEA